MAKAAEEKADGFWGAIGGFLAKIAEICPALLTVLGAIVFLLGAAGGIASGTWLTIKEGVPQYSVEAFGALMAVAGLVVWALDGPARRNGSGGISNMGLDPARFAIGISNPVEGERVSTHVDVRGTIGGELPEGYSLRVLRYFPPSQRFVPAGTATFREGGTKWEVLNCPIGGSPGDRRRLAAVLVGPTGKVLFDYFEEASKLHQATMGQLEKLGGVPEYLPALSERTPDVVECASVNVCRA